MAAGRSPKITLCYIAKVTENPKMTYYGFDRCYHKCHLPTRCNTQYDYTQSKKKVATAHHSHRYPMRIAQRIPDSFHMTFLKLR